MSGHNVIEEIVVQNPAQKLRSFYKYGMINLNTLLAKCTHAFDKTGLDILFLF
jgi:hypothetical protein